MAMAMAMASAFVSFDDVVRHTLKNLEEAAIQDNVKTCKTLTQNLLKEIILGQRNQKNNNRRVAVERGVVQSVILLLKQFSVAGGERDQTLRLQLVVTCLDLLLDLKPFVLLDDKESVPVCILLRSFGVSVVVRSMMMHWGLRSRSVPLLCKSLRVLVNVSMSEQGARMLVDSQAHAVILQLLAHERIRDRESRFLMVRILATVALFDSASIELLAQPDSVKLLFAVANAVPTSDFAFHKEICCILCVVAAYSIVAAQSVMSAEPLGYVVQVLHSASSKAASNANDSSVRADYEHAILLQEKLRLESQQGVGQEAVEVIADDGGNSAEQLDHITQTQDAAAATGSAVTDSSHIGAGNSRGISDSTPTRNNERTSPTMALESLNSTAKNAYSAGSQLVSSFIRGPTVKGNISASGGIPASSNGSRPSLPAARDNARDPYADDTLSATGDADCVSCWAAMLMHNLCLGQKNDLTMRMVISQAFDASLSGSNDMDAIQQRPLFARVAASMQAICASNIDESQPATNSGAAEENLIDFGDSIPSPMAPLMAAAAITKPDTRPKDYLVQLVDDIVIGKWSAEAVDTPFSSSADNEFCARAVLFNLDLLHAIHGPAITLEALLHKLVARFHAMLAPDAGPFALPLPSGCSRIVSFAFLLLGHPLYQRILAELPEAMNVLVGPRDDSLLSGIRVNTPPEYFSVILRCLKELVDVEAVEICILPVLPYTSFSGVRKIIDTPFSRRDHDVGDDVTLKRQCSVDPSRSGGSPTAVGRHSTAEPQFDTAQGGAAAKDQPKSISVATPSRFSLRSSNNNMNGGGQLHAIQLKSGSVKEMRSSNPYMPSNSHVILSPLLSDLRKGGIGGSKPSSAMTPPIEGSRENSPKSANSSSAGGGGFEGADENVSCGASCSSSPVNASLNNPNLSDWFETNPTNNPSPKLSLFEWRRNPQAVAVQISLRLEKMYIFTDPGKLVLLAVGPRALARELCGAEIRFLEECHKVAFFLKREVLLGDTSFNRARIIECIIGIALCAASPLLRNAALALACIDALSSNAVRRLELSWRNVSLECWEQFDELKRACGVKDSVRGNSGVSVSNTDSSRNSARSSVDEEKSQTAEDEWELMLAGAQPVDLRMSSFLSGARIPYLLGLIAALRQAAAQVQVSPVPTLVTVDNVNISSKQSRHSLKKKSPTHEEPDLLSFDDDDGKNISVVMPAAAPTNSDKTTMALLGVLGNDEPIYTAGLKPEPLTRVSSLGSNIGPDSFDPLGLFAASNSSEGGERDTANGGHGLVDSSASTCSTIDLRSVHLTYAVLCEWIPTIRSNGDWFQRVYAYQPDVQMQIHLKDLPKRPSSTAHLATLDLISLRQEPPWALDQMLLESLYAIEGWIESLFESDTEEEGKVIIAFRTKIRNQDRSGDNTVPVGSFAAPVNVHTSASISSASAKSLQSAAANIFRNNNVDTNSAGVPDSTVETAFRSSLDTLPKIPAPAVGKLINSLVKKISVSRRQMLLQESGSRSAEHWDKIAGHVRLTVERIVLSPIRSRLSLAAMREHISQECALQERTLLLRNLRHERIADLLGLPTRNYLGQCKWQGAVATLKGFDDADMPSLKIKVLLRLKDDIFTRAAENGVNDMNADEFLPIMTFVIVKAQLQHPYATTMLLRDLLSDEFVSGEAAYYLTTFEIALGHLLHMPLPQDVLDIERDLSRLDDEDFF